jgi:hypothetical protein
MTITVDTNNRRDGKALALFARCTEWQQGKPKDGRSFFAIPGSERGLLHVTDTRDCTCADRQRSRNVCKHMQAVRFWMAAYQTGAVAPKLQPNAMAEDQRIALTPDGAAYIAGLDAGAPLADDTSIEASFAGARADHDARHSARRRMSYAELMDNHLVPA